MKMDQARAHYAKFGDAVVQKMLQYVFRPNGLRQILERLSLGGPGIDDGQAHARIVAYIQQKGAGHFIKVLQTGARSHKTPAFQAPPQSPRPARDTDPGAASNDEPKPAQEASRGEENRRHPRFQTDLEVSSLVKPSEGSASCFESKGRIRDVSALGLCLIVPNLPKRWHSALCRSRGYVEIDVQLPDESRESKVKGTIAWMDFHGDDPEPYCRIGVDLGRSDRASKDTVRKLVSFSRNQSGAGSQ